MIKLNYLFRDVGAQIIYVGPDETYTNIKWALGQASDGEAPGVAALVDGRAHDYHGRRRVAQDHIRGVDATDFLRKGHVDIDA